MNTNRNTRSREALMLADWTWLLLLYGGKLAAVTAEAERETLLTPALVSPGDTAVVGGMRLMLHQDRYGNRFVSATSSEILVTYGSYAHTHNFRPAAELEEKLFRLERKRRNLTASWDTTITPSENTADGTNCDCSLEDLTKVMATKQHHTDPWLVNHAETQPGDSCPHHSKQAYETLVNQPGTGQPTCTITPARWIHGILEKLRAKNPRDIIKQLNRNMTAHCAVEGSYNLKTIPRQKLRKAQARTMIDCALQCMFDTTCTTWTFDMEGAPRCWNLDLGTHRPKFNERSGGPYVTGGKECLPCILRNRVETPTGGDMRHHCRLKPERDWGETVRCACSQENTLTHQQRLLEEVVYTAATNNIENDPNPSPKRSIKHIVDGILRELRTTKGGLVELGKILTNAASGSPEGTNGTKSLTIVRKLKQVLGPGIKIYTSLVPLAKLAASSTSTSPELKLSKLEGRTTYLPTSLPTATEIGKLASGALASFKSVRGVLNAVQRFLQASDREKNKITEMATGIPGYRELQETPNTPIPSGANALRMTVDTGMKTTQVAIFPYKGYSETTTVTAIPTPTTSQIPGMEPAGAAGHWTTPRHYNRLRPAETLPEDCAREILAEQHTTESCAPQQNYFPANEHIQIPLKHMGTTTRLVRIHTSINRGLPYTITCGVNKTRVWPLGMMLLTLGEKCSLTDEGGRMLAYPISRSGTRDREYRVLLNEAIKLTSDGLAPKDLVQLIVLGLLVTTGILVGIYWQRKRRPAAATEEGGPEPEMERIHPEAGTPEPEEAPNNRK